jgi:hypothetical protein
VQALEEHIDAPEDKFRAVGDGELDRVAREQIPSEIRECDVRTRRTECRDEHMTSRPTNAKSSGRATAAANDRVIARQQPCGSQLADAFRDRGAAKTRDLDDVSLRCGAPKANRVEYPGHAVQDLIIPASSIY